MENKNRNEQANEFHLSAEDFLPASSDEKQETVVMRESISFWKDALQRLVKRKVTMAAFIALVIVFVFAFIVPSFYPYTYDQQVRGSENLHPFEYSEQEQARIDKGEDVPPHPFGTDSLGRDMFIRVMMGTRVSLIVGLVASFIVLIIGSIYGSVAGYFGGRVDMVMMRIVDVVSTIPDILIIILLSFALKEPLNKLFASNSALSGISLLGPSLVSIFITFSLLYWVSMARIVRGQVMSIKQQEFVTAARAMGSDPKRVIARHLLPNSLGTIIVTATLQIPSAIFTESYLSFLGLGVSAPMPSLGSLASDALNGITSYTYRLIAPAAVISIIILAFNLFGDGLRDVFDPKLKK